MKDNEHGYSIEYSIDINNHITWVLENNPTRKDITKWAVRNRSYERNNPYINKVITQWKKHYEK